MDQINKPQSEVDMVKYHLCKIAEKAFIENADASSFVPGVSRGFSSLQTTMTKDVFVGVFVRYFKKPLLPFIGDRGKLPLIMERIKQRTGIPALDMLESEISKILGE